MKYLSSYNRPVEVLDERIGGIPNLHYGKMKRICMLKPAQIAKEYGFTEFTTKNGKKFWFKDNGSRVLGVAHADTVKPFRHFRPVKFAEDTKIFCQTLDDRLGLYILLEYLQHAKIKIDILMTTDEEKMASTGLYFGPPKQYNWMFMFDRGGTDAVTYKYGDEQLKYKLGKHNFEHNIGTYSCITDMEHVGCKGINFGVGYHDNHGEYAWASRKELYSQLRKFIDFFREYETTFMPHDEDLNRFVSRYWKHYEDHKADLKGQYSVVATHEEVQVIEKAREKREKRENCGCEICMSGVDCKDFPALQGPVEKRRQRVTGPSEDIGKDKSIAYVDKDGKITRVEKDRHIFLLYENINQLAGVGMDVKNILRNTFGIKKVWDLAVSSAYALLRKVDSKGVRYLDTPDIDALDLALQDFGFGFGWNVQGYRLPDDEELRLTFGYKRREKIMKAKHEPTSKTKLTPKMGLFVAGIPIKPAATKVRQTITMFPTKAFDLPKMIAKANELSKQGYDIQMFNTCNECHQTFQWDYTKTDLAPERCTKCAVLDESQLSFTFAQSTDHVPEEGAGVLGLMQLRKDPLDDSEFTFIGKEDGATGIDKYGWVDPIRKFEEIGFVVA
jgi:hypothetical protein